MKIHRLILAIFSLVTSYSFAQEKILIITGGHDFEENEFFEMFDSYKQLTYEHSVQPEGNKLIEDKKINEYDALVFYDMYQEITDAQKAAYLQALGEGKGMVFLHHSLVSYQKWPEFKQIIGGKYLLEDTEEQSKSTYKHDVDFTIEVVSTNKNEHPIIKGIDHFQIRDEVYGNFVVNNNVTPLIKTNHPQSTSIIGWCHEYKNSRIVFLQPGHDHHAYENDNYRLLLRQAISWVSSN